MIKAIIGVRFFAAIGIVLHHMGYPFSLGTVFVTFFFLLSGFSMALGYRKKFENIFFTSIYSFYKKRLVRVYPMVFITFLVALPVMYIEGHLPDMMEIVVYILMLQSWWANGMMVFTINGVAWFISDLILFYIFTPFLLYYFNKLGGVGICFIIFIIYAIEIYIASCFIGEMQPYSWAWWCIYICPWYRIMDYSIGMLCGMLYAKNLNKVRIKGKFLCTTLEVFSIMFLIFSIWSPYYGYDSFKYGLYYIPASIMIIVLLAYSRGYVSALLSCGVFVALGDISYHIYILHQIIIRYFQVLDVSFLGLSLNMEHLIIQTFVIITILCISTCVKRHSF